MRVMLPDRMVRVCNYSAIATLMYAVSASFLLFGFAFFTPIVLGSEQKLQTPIEKWTSAIANDRIDTLAQMLDQQGDDKSGAQALLRNVASNGKSALMVASKQGELAVAKRMVKLGANVNQRTQTGGTPFMFAVLGNHLALARWLHQSGADINAKGSNGWSAATIAGAKGQTDMLRWLIEAGADINSPDVYRFTPLMRAVDNQHTDSVKILLQQGKASVKVKDESDNTALHFAVANQHSDVIKLLLHHGADPFQVNRDGISPADLAKQYPELSEVFAQ